MKKIRKTDYFIYLLVDFVLIGGSFYFSVWFSKRHMTGGYPDLAPKSFVIELLSLSYILIVWLISSRITGLYNEFRILNSIHELGALVKNTLALLFWVVILLFLLKNEVLSRYFLIIFIFISFLLLLIYRLVLRYIKIFLRKRGRNLKKVILIGAGETGKKLYKMFSQHPGLGYKVDAILDDFIADRKDVYTGRIEEIEEILNTIAVDEIIITLPDHNSEKIESVLRLCKKYPILTKIISDYSSVLIPDYYRLLSDRYQVSNFRGMSVFLINKSPLDLIHWKLLKRIFDLVSTLICFVFVFSWLWPMIAILIKLGSKGPVFFKQERWGKKNNKIICYKFRSMVSNSSDLDYEGNYQMAIQNDPRVTRLGKLLRKTSLDETPQFINVLKGEMSVVGPRPHPTPLNLEAKEQIRNYMQRHLVKPGITGWAQVNGLRGRIKDDGEMQQRIDFDLWYIENWSFWLDIQILLLTVWKMIKGDSEAY